MDNSRENGSQKTEFGRECNPQPTVNTQRSTLNAQRATRNAQPAFTLLEVLVSLVIFGIITAALTTAMSSSLRARVLFEQRQEDGETVRGVFATLSRDLQSAFGSKYDPNSLFVAGSSGGSSQSASNGALLQLSALTHRINTTDPGVDPSIDPSSGGLSAAGAAKGGTDDPPQQPTELVRYDLDPQAGTLSRLTQSVPNLQTFQQALPGPDNIIASGVVSLKLQFWDSTQQTWRDDWDFEQPNLPPPPTTDANGNPTSSATAATGATGTSGTTGSSTSATGGTGTGDASLPSAVQITLVLHRRDGTPGTYSAILPIIAPQVQDYPFKGGLTFDPDSPPPPTTGGSTGSGQ